MVQISTFQVQRNLHTRASKIGTPKSRHFTAVGQSIVKTVADKHGHAAYHNMH